MGNHQASSYTVDTIAKDFVQVYRRASIQTSKHVQPVRMRRTNSVISVEDYLRNTVQTQQQRISLAEMELECDGRTDKCRLVPRKRQHSSVCSSSTNSSLNSSSPSRKRNLRKTCSVQSSQSCASVLSNKSISSCPAQPVSRHADISGQIRQLPSVSEMDYTVPYYC